MSYQPSEKLKAYVKNGNIKILGITGKMFSGKDTVAEFVHFAFRNSRITSFAYPMKQMMIDYFGFTYEDLYTVEGKNRYNEFWGMTNREALQKIGTETCDVSDVVAHVIRDRRRIAGIVLGNVRFRLADEIGAHVRRLRIDAAAHAVKQRNDRTAERITRYRHGERRLHADEVFADRPVHDVVDLSQCETEHAVNDENAQKREARDAKPHDRTALKSDFERLARVARFVGGFSNAHVGVSCYFHAYEARARAHNRADEESYHRFPGNDNSQNACDDNSDDCDNFVLVSYERVSAFANGCCNFLHPVVALFELTDEEEIECGISECKQRGEQHE